MAAHQAGMLNPLDPPRVAWVRGGRPGGPMQEAATAAVPPAAIAAAAMATPLRRSLGPWQSTAGWTLGLAAILVQKLLIHTL